MALSKKSILTTALAVTLAMAVVLGGGTYAYLQSSTGDTVNTFNTNQVTVSLEETTGSEYEIIPGTSQDKDPTVKVLNTVDAYVYVEVTDTTDGLVDYTIADSWIKLGGFENIYYREVAAGAAVKEFDVLEGNSVSYGAELENSNMLDANGALREGLSLTFNAYAVQKSPFNDPIKAYYQSDTTADTADTLSEAISNAENSTETTIIVSKDIETSGAPIVIPDGKNITLALAGNTVTGTASETAVIVAENAVLNISDGTIIAPSGKAGIENDGTAVLDNIKVLRTDGGASAKSSVTNDYYVLVNHGTMTLNDGVYIEAPHSGTSLVENGYVDGSAQTAPVKLVINGGSYIGGLNPVKNDDWGVLEINGGYFECRAEKQFCVVNYNELTINGGTFVSDYRVVWNGSLNDTYDKGQVTVTGGDFTAKQAYMFWNKLNENLGNEVTTTDKGFMTFSGGTFKSRNANESSMFAGPNAWKYVHGFKLVKNSDGSCSVVSKEI